MKVPSPSLLVRGRSNQRGESSLHEISLDAANSHERVRHRGSARVEAVRRVRRRRRRVALLVEAAAERARMRRRRAHAGPLLLVVVRTTALPRHAGSRRHRDGPVRRDGAVEGEADGGSGGTAEVDTCRRGRAVKEGGGARSEAGGGRGES